MKKQLNYLVKLSSMAFFSWLKINVFGGLNTIVALVVGIVTLINYSKAVEGVNDQAASGFFMIFVNRPVACAMLIILLLSPILYFIVGNKYIISKLINKLVTDTSDNFINPFVDSVLTRFKAQQPGFIKKGVDSSLVKLKLIDQIRTESGNKILKNILTYGMNKVQLGDVDFSKDNSTEIIKSKITAVLHNVTEPSKIGLWLIFIFQWLLIAVVGCLPY